MFADAIGLILTGFSVVMVALASLWAACAAIGYCFTNAAIKAKAAAVFGGADAAAAAAPAPAAPAAPAPTSGVPPHHLVAIAAAVASTLGGSYVVTNVAAPAHEVSAWPTEGRNSIYSSHVTRHGWGAPIPTTVVAGRATTTKRG
ncbi:hypothetical protein FDK21_11420 [Cohaesibacter sp. CAU 1516]|uniref:hypothetical protein n=1 Tax=Cohaesibacter sp. CAU 1516 TaxID=2576038 RepID=UPI0010FF3977|nr:hypothetical protein [Cohaesibacter sp. CAU 1516]TLP46210.1 hypothetical protein FDK21_11420 [Cohaesibacter sp. CAU 1516]